MKALSLWQPWASLIADGRKKIETRHWMPPESLLGQEFMIHAAMRTDVQACRGFGYNPLTIPRGCAVAVVRLLAYEKFGNAAREKFGHPEVDFGNFEAGCFGWFLDLISKFSPPIPSKGHQGLWNWSRF